MSARHFLPSLLLLIFPTLAPANGGGYRYGTNFTGSLAPFQPEGTENVQILAESLDITLLKSSAKVSVRYLMKNLTDADTSVRFGFPVEVISDDSDALGDAPSTKQGSADETAKYCRDYSASADGNPLRSSYLPEPFAAGKIKPFPGSDALAGIQGWMVSDLTFKKGQSREIAISYSSDYDISEFSVSEDIHRLPATFRYRLSTGGVWGGPISKGTVTVRSEGIPHTEVTIHSPTGRFKPSDNSWTWTFENLEPTLADDITIHAIPGFDEFRRMDDSGKWFGYSERRGVWGQSHQNFTATASSSLPPYKDISYGPENLTNNDWDPDLDEPEAAFRAWSEGAKGDGIGEFLDITPASPQPLTAINLQNGYAKSEALFAANNRVKSLTVTLNGDFSFDAELEDHDLLQPIFIRGYDKPVSKLRLTIKDVYRGSKARDTCISNLELVRRLAKKPEVQGAR